jgi:hypothetical protein
MTAIEQLACKSGRKDEVPNIELAEKLCAGNDKKGIGEIAGGLQSKDQAVANDCIKVLYEAGKIKPELVADYTDDFITLLSSKNNRLAWGGMTALALIVPIKPKEVYDRLPEVIAAYKKGSVITVDNSISVFAGLCEANDKYQKVVFPILLDHLTGCRAKEIPQHAERISICINPGNKEEFLKALDARKNELTETQLKRIENLKKKIQKF